MIASSAGTISQQRYFLPCVFVIAMVCDLCIQTGELRAQSGEQTGDATSASYPKKTSGGNKQSSGNGIQANWGGSGTSNSYQPTGQDPFGDFKTNIINQGPTGLVNYGNSSIINTLFDPNGNKNPQATGSLTSQLQSLADTDSQHATAYRELAERVDKCATIQEVRDAIADTVSKFDERLGAQAQQLYDLERSRDEFNRMLRNNQLSIDNHGKRIRELNVKHNQLASQVGLNREMIMGLETKYQNLNQKVTAIGGRVSKVEKEIEEFRRWNPPEVAVRAAVAGAELYRQGKAAEAVPLLRQGLAYAPDDCGIAYILAMALKSAGKEDEARMAAAFGIAAEHKRGPSNLWNNISERFQGQDRQFLSALRNDPINGARSSGVYRILEVVDDPKEPGSAKIVQISTEESKR